jgi:DNA-binding NarL/FixJ family response regulator
MGDARAERGLVGIAAEPAEAGAFSGALDAMGWQAVPVDSPGWADLVQTFASTPNGINLVAAVNGAGAVPASLPNTVRISRPTSVVLLGRRRNFAALAHAVQRYSATVLDADQPFHDLLAQLVGVLDGSLNAAAPRRLVRLLRELDAEAQRFAQLSWAEREVMSRLLAGLTPDRIARTESVQITTVRTHIRRIFSKIGVHSQIELLAAARRSYPPGLILWRPVENDHRQY